MGRNGAGLLTAMVLASAMSTMSHGQWSTNGNHIYRNSRVGIGSGSSFSPSYDLQVLGDIRGNNSVWGPYVDIGAPLSTVSPAVSNALVWYGDKVWLSHRGGTTDADIQVGSKGLTSYSTTVFINRTAMDTVPSSGGAPSTGLISGFRIYRTSLSDFLAGNYEKATFGGMAEIDQGYLIEMESAGTGQQRPLSINHNSANGLSESIKLMPDGQVVFGYNRAGVRMPLDMLHLMTAITAEGLIDSDAVRWTGKTNNSGTVHRADWRAYVDVLDYNYGNQFAFDTRKDTQSYAKVMQVSTGGQMTVPQGNIVVGSVGKGVVLTSPNGTKWLMTVDNTGLVKVTAYQP
jgi:hypothetical protein